MPSGGDKGDREVNFGPVWFSLIFYICLEVTQNDGTSQVKMSISPCGKVFFVLARQLSRRVQQYSLISRLSITVTDIKTSHNPNKRAQ